MIVCINEGGFKKVLNEREPYEKSVSQQTESETALTVSQEQHSATPSVQTSCTMEEELPQLF